ncbi:MAG: tyrosine-type recombinase/integrase [Methylocystis sp.]|uniref:tyrosine-type recombinase/integrase n=1 Tax=Methylocystis sp. TaxID=1911079 RepID=UPI003DA32A7A
MADAGNKIKITKTSVDALAPREKPWIAWDTDLTGFGVRVQPSGVKSYVVQFYVGGGGRNADEPRRTIGKTATLTAVQARKAAADLLAKVRLGADPVAEQRAAQAIPSFAEIADEWLAAHVKAKRKGRTAKEYERILKTVLAPAFGKTRFTDLRHVDAARLHEGMAETPALANRALAIVSSIWGWAARRKIVSAIDNPAKGIERYPEHGRERFLSSAEFARLGDALHEAETVGLVYDVDDDKPKAKHAPKADNRRTIVDPFAIAAIRLLILTGARLQEIVAAKWSYVDVERGILFLPTSKTGRKPVYLSAAALQVLADMPRVDGNEYVIAGSKTGRPRTDLKRPWAAITKAAALDGLRLHDLRHSFASLGAGGGLGLPIVGKLLGHSQPATTQRYAHLDADPLRRAVDAIGDRIDGMMGRRSADVVPIRRQGGK